tara:strand:- start:169 stop:1194 length:1026 start_codon:yes stop_codon:yes gene_type:complete
MPQVKEPLLKRLVKESLKEAESSFGPDNTKFKIGVDVGNPQSETKLGLRIKLRPSEGYLEPEKKGELEAAIMTKMNNSLEQFNIQVSKDTDVPDPEVMGFFIPLPQLKNMIVSSLGGSTDTDIASAISDKPSPPKPPSKSIPKPPTAKPPTDIQKDDKEDLKEEDPLDRAARLAKEPLAGMGDMTGLGLKRSGYEGEVGGELTLEELFEKLATAYEALVDAFKDIYHSDYKFKDYYDNNEDHITRTMGVVSMMKDDIEDRLKVQEPVGPDQGIEELKKVIKSQLNEMRVRDLNEASRIVIKEDYYNLINAGNNIVRTFEENGKTIKEAKAYIKHLVAHNIL